MYPFRLHLSATARSEMGIRSEVADLYDLDEEAGTVAALRAFDGTAITITSAAHGAAIWRGLIDLSNTCDDLSREPAVGPEERAFNRHAAAGLAGACSRLTARLRVAA